MTNFNMKFLPDEPINNNDDDLLGLGEFVDLIHGAIANTQTPFVYGVLGDWGVGKTSILRLLQSRYGSFSADGPNIVPIWFNAWAYENESNLVYPLLYAIKHAYERDVDQPTRDKNPFLDRLSTVVASSALVLGDIGLRVATKTLTGDAYKLDDLKKHLEDIQEHKGLLEEVFSQWADNVGQLKDSFAELLRIYAKNIAQKHGIPSDTVRFLILIDDLDRCLPDTTIAILESIKNHLSVKRAVFMLGLNPRIVYQGIRHKYGNVEINGREYLEKILNYTFYVPETETNRVVDFVMRHFANQANEDFYAKHEKDLMKFGQVLRDCNFNNPRKIKRIINRYLLFISKYTSEREIQRRHQDYREAPLEDWFLMANIARLLVIAEYYPEIFQLFLSDIERYQEEMKNLLRTLSASHSISSMSKISEFEETTGVNLAGIFPQLSRMKSLFEDLPEQKHKDKPTLKYHVQAVFSITRLI